MADFEIGDKVKVTGSSMNGVTGVITTKSIRPVQITGKIATGRGDDTQWQIKLDATGTLRTFPPDELEKIG